MMANMCRLISIQLTNDPRNIRRNSYATPLASAAFQRLSSHSPLQEEGGGASLCSGADGLCTKCPISLMV